METIKMKSIVSSPVHSLSHSLSAFPMGTFKQRWFREVMFILSQNTNTIHIENHPHAIPIYCSFGVLFSHSLSLSRPHPHTHAPTHAHTHTHTHTHTHARTQPRPQPRPHARTHAHTHTPTHTH